MVNTLTSLTYLLFILVLDLCATLLLFTIICDGDNLFQLLLLSLTACHKLIVSDYIVHVYFCSVNVVYNDNGDKSST